MEYIFLKNIIGTAYVIYYIYLYFLNIHNEPYVLKFFNLPLGPGGPGNPIPVIPGSPSGPGTPGLSHFPGGPGKP